MKRSIFNFDLPEELIAQRPAELRDGARMLFVDASSGVIRHASIRDLPEFIPPRTMCVPNDVKVRHARLFLRRAGGGSGEALLIRILPCGAFEAMVRPGSKLKSGKKALVVDPSSGQTLATLIIEESLEDGLRKVRVQHNGLDLDWPSVDRIGHLPLPPYISHPAGQEDEERYQTIFHSGEGEAVAAPTAGLHFTPDLIDRLKSVGCSWNPVRLHVGLGTFRPMTAEDTDDHVMHEERFEIPEKTALELEKLLHVGHRPLLAIGTTSLRTMEAAWDGHSLKRSGSTRLFIQPGYRLTTINHLLTNFHLPESTLFVLVAAILGIELAKEAYSQAIREKYRFFSYGDAMLIANTTCRP